MPSPQQYDPSATLKELMDTCCALIEQPRTLTRYLYNGKRLQETRTLAQVRAAHAANAPYAPR